MAAKDPIASNVGHGAYGLRSNLRQFSDFALKTDSQKQVFVELRANRLISPGNTWTVVSGTTYEVVFPAGTFNGKTLDIVGVKTLGQSILGETLVRRESVAAVTATAGSFHYDRDTETITVRLSTATTNPNSFGTIAEVAFYYGSHAVVMPHFGTEKLVDGGFETWTSATNLTHWSEELDPTSPATDFSVDRESSDIQVGTFACKLTSAGTDTGSASVYIDTTDALAEQAYCVSGLYKTPATQSANLSVRVVVSDGGSDNNVVQSDGRSYLTGTEPTLTPTNGEWRRFEFYYVQRTIAPSANARLRLKLAAPSSAGVGYVLFDAVEWRPVWAWNLYEPRVESISQFSVREGRQDVYWGSWTSGVGSFTLLNSGPAPGYFDELVGRYLLMNSPVYVREGGRFSDDAEEVTPTGLHMAWFARTKRPEVTEQRADFQIRDLRDLFDARLPQRVYNLADQPDMDPRMSGAPRPLITGGSHEHVNAVRVDVDGTTAYGVYEYADPTDTVNGFYDSGALGNLVGYAYDSPESAAAQDITRRRGIYDAAINADDPSEPHVTINYATGRISVISDVRVHLNPTPRFLNFTRNGTTYRGSTGTTYKTMNIGLMCEVLKDSMNTAAGVASITVTYSNSTHKVTIADATAATFTLLTQTGADTGAQALAPTLGYTVGSDKTGALTYTAEAAIFTDVDADHILRWRVYGIKDNAAGTYTGSASALVTAGPDVLRYRLVNDMGIDPAMIDTTSFNALRAAYPLMPSYIGVLSNDSPGDTAEEFGTIVGRMETTMQADLQIVGDRFYLKARSDSAPANVVDVYDTDIVMGSFSSWIDDEDIFGTVHIAYDQDASLGTWKQHSKGLSRVALQYGRPDQKRFETYIIDSADAETLRDDLSAIAETPKRKFRMRVKGKLYTKTVADVFRLNRTRGVTDTSGASPYTTAVLCRIVDRTNTADMVTDVLAVEV